MFGEISSRYYLIFLILPVPALAEIAMPVLRVFQSNRTQKKRLMRNSLSGLGDVLPFTIYMPKAQESQGCDW